MTHVEGEEYVMSAGGGGGNCTYNTTHNNQTNFAGQRAKEESQTVIDLRRTITIIIQIKYHTQTHTVYIVSDSD